MVGPSCTAELLPMKLNVSINQWRISTVLKKSVHIKTQESELIYLYGPLILKLQIDPKGLELSLSLISRSLLWSILKAVGRKPRTSIRRNLKTLVYCKLKLKSIASLRLNMLVLDTRFLVRVLVLLVRLLSDIGGLLPGWNSASMP